jgi:hypothetical protein
VYIGFEVGKVNTEKYPNSEAFAMNQAISGIVTVFYWIPEMK